MTIIKMEMDLSNGNPFMGKDMEEKMKKRIFAHESSEFLRVVPYIDYDFYESLTSDGYLMPGPDKEGDSWDESMDCAIQPMSTSMRIMIRPDVSKEKAVMILHKITMRILEDRTNWKRKLKKYIAELKAEVDVA